jgi:hypothetical protein
MTITIYGIKNCDTMKKARAWLDGQGVEYAFHNYKTAGIGRDRLEAWAKALGWETLLNELGFNRDWIEKCLAHEDGRSSRGGYNKAEYEVQRRHMMQEWADTVDAWVEGRKYVPTLLPTVMPPIALDPAL